MTYGKARRVFKISIIWKQAGQILFNICFIISRICIYLSTSISPFRYCCSFNKLVWCLLSFCSRFSFTCLSGIKPLRFCCYIPGSSTVYLLDSFVAVRSHKLNSLTVWLPMPQILHMRNGNQTRINRLCNECVSSCFFYVSLCYIWKKNQHQNAFDTHAHLC